MSHNWKTYWSQPSSSSSSTQQWWQHEHQDSQWREHQWRDDKWWKEWWPQTLCKSYVAATLQDSWAFVVFFHRFRVHTLANVVHATEGEDGTPRRTHTFFSLVSVAHLIALSHAHACGSRLLLLLLTWLGIHTHIMFHRPPPSTPTALLLTGIRRSPCATPHGGLQFGHLVESTPLTSIDSHQLDPSCDLRRLRREESSTRISGSIASKPLDLSRRTRFTSRFSCHASASSSRIWRASTSTTPRSSARRLAVGTLARVRYCCEITSASAFSWPFWDKRASAEEQAPRFPRDFAAPTCRSGWWSTRPSKTCWPFAWSALRFVVVRFWCQPALATCHYKEVLLDQLVPGHLCWHRGGDRWLKRWTLGTPHSLSCRGQW